jgi:hypothetical protein
LFLFQSQKSLRSQNFFFYPDTHEKLKTNETKLRKLNITKDKFFSIIAHDLKNPFTVLISNSELLLMYLEKNNEEKNFNEAVALQAVAANRVSAAEAAIPVLEQAVVDATPVEPEKPVEPPVEPVEPPVVPLPLPPVVEPLPPIVEPVSPIPPKEPDITSIPLSEINPQELTEEEVTRKFPAYTRVVKLKFRPKVEDPADPFYQQIIETQCVLCGGREGLSLHHVVPSVIRKHLPDEHKNHSHGSHQNHLVLQGHSKIVKRHVHSNQL